MKCGPCGELYRDPSRGKIAGVCAGLAQYFGWETWFIRILVVSGVLVGMPWLVMIYIAAWFILDKKIGTSEQPIASTIKGKVFNVARSSVDFSNESIKVKVRTWQAGEPPKKAFHDIRRKFTVLEQQLRSMESYITSAEFTVSREINKL